MIIVITSVVEIVPPIVNCSICAVTLWVCVTPGGNPFTETEPTAPPTLKLIPSNVVPGHKFWVAAPGYNTGLIVLSYVTVSNGSTLIVPVTVAALQAFKFNNEVIV